MSQHVIASTLRKQPVTVSLGWDRQLQGFFMTVRRDRTKNVAYSNMVDPQLARSYGLASNLEFFRSTLKRLRVRVPPVVFDGVDTDAENDVGNRVVIYEEDGTVRVDQVV